MVGMREVGRQLKEIGFRNKYFGWSAIGQLPAILDENEIIEQIATGWYDAGLAVVIATDKRILFLDKKPISFKVEDVHYEMVSEVEHRVAPVHAVLRIYCLSKRFELKSLSQANIRRFAIHVENKVNRVRLNMQNWNQMLEAAQLQRGNAPAPVLPMPFGTDSDV